MKNKNQKSGLREKLKRVTIIYSTYRWYLWGRKSFIKRVRFLFLIFVRARKPITKLFKKKYLQKYRMNLEMTYHCNLKCNNCNRFCSQAPANEYLTIEQIKKFIKESTDNNVKWDRISIGGGEPTLHPNVLEILDLLLEYKKGHSPNTTIVIYTNGYGKKINNIISKIPEEIFITNSKKRSNVQRFHPINLAPIDSVFYKNIDFSIGCYAVPDCGISLTPFGYYPCPIAGAIDRVFGFDIGRKKLPLPDDPMLEMLPVLCRFCGAFRYAVRTKKQVMSPSWRTVFQKYRKRKPNLSPF